MLKIVISKVRGHLKNSFDRIRNEHFKKNLLQAIPFWIASIITGLIAVAYARLFFNGRRFNSHAL